MAILWRQDGFVIDRFRRLSEDYHQFPDQLEHKQLVAEGEAALKSDDIERLRNVVARMDSVRLGSGSDDDLIATTNIVLG